MRVDRACSGPSCDCCVDRESKIQRTGACEAPFGKSTRLHRPQEKQDQGRADRERRDQHERKRSTVSKRCNAPTDQNTVAYLSKRTGTARICLDNELQVLPIADDTQDHHEKREDRAAEEERDQTDQNDEYRANDPPLHPSQRFTREAVDWSSGTPPNRRSRRPNSAIASKRSSGPKSGQRVGVK